MIIDKQIMQRIITILIVLSPIFNIYKMGNLPLSFGDFGLCLAIIISFVIDVNEGFIVRKKDFYFLPVFFFYFITSMVSIAFQGGDFNASDLLSKWSRLVIYGFLLDVVVPKKMIFSVAEKWISKLSFFLACTVIIQEIMKNMGVVIAPFIKGLVLNYNVSTTELLDEIYMRNGWGLWRVSSIFPEPSHFSYFVLTGLIIILFSKEFNMIKKGRFLAAVVITISLLICESAIGYFTAGLLWIIWLWVSFRDRITIRRMLVIIFFLSVALFLFLKTGSLEKALYRLGTVQSFSEGATGGVRLLQGIFVYIQTGIIEHFIGVGFGNVSYYLIRNKITTPFLTDIGNEYMNVFSTVLVSGGIIGFCIYLLIWFRMWMKNKNILSRMFWIVITVLACTSSIFYSCTLIVFLALVLCKKEEK